MLEGRHLRRRLLLPRGAAGAGPHPHPDVGGPRPALHLDRAIAAFVKVGQEPGSHSVKALVKSKREAGLWMEELPKPSCGPNDVLIKVRKTAICGTDIHIYNWDEWSAAHHPRRRWSSATSSWARSPSWAARCTGFTGGRSRLGRGPHHLRALPQLPRRQAPPVPQHGGPRRQPPGLLRRVRHPAGLQRLPGAQGDPRRDRGLLRPAGQRGAHRPVLRPRRRGRADHRRRPHRRHGRGHRQARRRAPRGGHRRQRLPAGAGQEAGRHPRGQRGQRVAGQTS